MSLLGIHLQLSIGPTVPIPAPAFLMEALKSVEVTHNDKERSGFQMIFYVGRSGPKDLLDYPLLKNPLLQPCNRVIMTVMFNAVPRVLMDGIIMNQQLQPGSEPGEATLTITGEDVSVMMDLEEKSVEHPAQMEGIIARKIILSYAGYGLLPIVIDAPISDPPSPTERIPVQQATDLQYLKEMAGRFSYVFYVEPGPAPAVNMAYWGPPKRSIVPQKALSVNLGPQTNVMSINFQNNASAPTSVSGQVQDRLTDRILPVQTITSTRPPLSVNQALLKQACVRRKIFRAESGQNAVQALASAQATTDDSTNVVTVQGELDATRYNDILQARGLVGLRGVGFSYDGLYYVESVTHSITQGEYKQSFSLTREGLGSTVATVRG